MAFHSGSRRRCHDFILALAVAFLAASTMQAQQARPYRSLAPRPVTPVLNNGSLATTVNPKAGRPGQPYWSHVAFMPQDLRLVLNGVPVDPSRLVVATNGFAPEAGGDGVGVSAPRGLIFGMATGFNRDLVPPPHGTPFSGQLPRPYANSSGGGFNPGFNPPPYGRPLRGHLPGPYANSTGGGFNPGFVSPFDSAWPNGQLPGQFPEWSGGGRFNNDNVLPPDSTLLREQLPGTWSKWGGGGSGF